MEKEYYEQRYLKSADLEAANSLLEGDEVKLTLRQALEMNSRIILLGDAGIGKSIELKHLFDQIWENKKDDLIPILIHLKNFRITNKFEDLIPSKSNWKSLSNLVFILDGLDEIADIHDFVSEFETFLSTINKHKFVISCRTNIYERYLVNISGFKAFYLNNLSEGQIHSILENGFQLPLKDIDTILKLPITTPFFLNVVADLIKNNENNFPKSIGEILDYFVEFTLKREKEKRIKKGLLDTFQLETNLKSLALVNELQQQNYITLTEINKILDNGLEELIENPLLVEIETDSNRFSFDHRQYQEYFVAKTLSEIDLNEIITAIKIPETNKVHPAYANVVSLLLNILEKEKKSGLIQWLQDNDVEILINSEENRISDEIRVSVFRSYFKKVVIDQTLWVGSRSSITDEKFARFGDCPQNFMFLLEILKTENHHRVAKMAVDLLSYFKLHDKEKLLSLYQEKLDLPEISKEEKAFILRGIIKHELHKTEKGLMSKLIRQFSDETHASINSALCRMIFDTERIDEFFNFILNEFEYVNELKERDEKDDTIRGVNWLLEKAIFKMTNPDNFITLFAHYTRHSIRTYSENFHERLIEQAVNFNSATYNVIKKLLQRLDEMKLKYADRRNKLIQTLVKECHGETYLWHYFLDNGKANEERWLLAEIANKELIDEIIAYIQTEENEFEYEGFRNILSHENPSLAEFFQKEMLESGFEFNSLIEFENPNIEPKKQNQHDLSIIFNAVEIHEKITNFLNRENVTEINNEKFYLIRRKYYENIPSSHILPVEYEIIHSIIDENLIKKPEILKRLNSPKYLLRIIKDHYESFKKIDLDEDKKEKVKGWLTKISNKFKFNDMLTYNGFNSFTFKSQEGKMRFDDFRLIMFFFDEGKFNFKPSQEFLLNALEFYPIKDGFNEDSGFSKIVEAIEDKGELKKRIISNIKKGIFSFAMRKHIKLALENNWDEALTEIGQFYRQTGEFRSNDQDFKTYIRKANDTKLLKECSENTNSYSAWVCLNLLYERNEEIEYIRRKSIDTLNEKDSSYKESALEILFRLGDDYALTYFVENYHEMIDKLSFKKRKEFNTVKPSDYGLIEQLFHKVYANTEGFDFHYGNEFTETLLIELSKDKDEYEKIKAVLCKIKNELNKNEDDRKFFYVNLLLGSIENARITELSKPMSFKEASIEAKRILSLH